MHPEVVTQGLDGATTMTVALRKRTEQTTLRPLGQMSAFRQLVIFGPNTLVCCATAVARNGNDSCWFGADAVEPASSIA